MENIAALEEKIKYTFNDKALLVQALTHSSFAASQNPPIDDNERLEFLGDAVLELSITDYLFNNHPDMDEGRMTKTRASVVCESALYAIAKNLGLASHLRLSKGEEISNGRDKPTILSDAMEAVIGAIYLDGGFTKAKRFVLKFVAEFIQENGMDVFREDYKTRLQEYVQKKYKGSSLSYKLIDEQGPDHKKTFIMQVLLNGEVIGEGRGATKQGAGQNAAHEALKRYA